MQYVIRSMTTTDYDWRRPDVHVTPYHVWLKPAGKRAGAYWTASPHEAAMFATPQEAEAEARRCLRPDEWDRVNIAPRDDRAMPAFWELAEMRGAR